MSWSTQQPGRFGRGGEVGRAVPRCSDPDHGPTQDAYEAACAALERHRVAAEAARRILSDRDEVILALRQALDRAQLRIQQLKQAAGAAGGQAPSAETAQPTDTQPTGPALHTCNGGAGPFFGRKTPGCPRCEELLGGAEPRQLPQWRQDLLERRDEDARRLAGLRAHFASEQHRRNQCGGLICTYGDW